MAMTDTTRAQFITTLEQTSQSLHRLTANLSDDALDLRSDPDEWTIREILAHLLDDEMFVMRTRLERMMKEENPQLASHDEKKWYSQRNTTRDQITQLLGDFAIQRQASLNMLSALRASEWARTAYHPEYGQFTAEEWLEHWAAHDTTHIHQIEHNLAAHTPR